MFQWGMVSALSELRPTIFRLAFSHSKPATHHRLDDAHSMNELRAAFRLIPTQTIVVYMD
jgi:hypothetical protein